MFSLLSNRQCVHFFDDFLETLSTERREPYTQSIPSTSWDIEDPALCGGELEVSVLYRCWSKRGPQSCCLLWRIDYLYISRLVHQGTATYTNFPSNITRQCHCGFLCVKGPIWGGLMIPLANWVLHPDTLRSTFLAQNMFLLLTVTADLITRPILAAFLSWSHFPTPLVFCFGFGLFCLVWFGFACPNET